MRPSACPEIRPLRVPAQDTDFDGLAALLYVRRRRAAPAAVDRRASAWEPPAPVGYDGGSSPDRIPARERGMQWAILGLVIFGLILTYIIFQETRAHHYWRGLVAKGDVTAIRMLLDQEIERWRTMRVPRGTPAALWHAVQTVDLVAVGPAEAQVACSVEGEYRVVGGQPQEVTSPIEAAMRAAAKICELIMYDIPNLRLSVVRVDVYSTFRDERGAPLQRCILTTIADRAEADDLDWEALRAHEIIGRFESRYHVNADGIAEPIEPGPLLEGTTPVAEIPAPADPDEPRARRGAIGEDAGSV
jgi:hypothetical protein